MKNASVEVIIVIIINSLILMIWDNTRRTLSINSINENSSKLKIRNAKKVTMEISNMRFISKFIVEFNISPFRKSSSKAKNRTDNITLTIVKTAFDFLKSLS